MQYVVDDQKVTGPFQVIVPVKTTPKVAQHTVSKISDQAVWNQAPDTSIPIYDVRQIRVRGMSAEVDIVRPVFVKQPDAGRQVATIYLHWDPFSGWVVREMRVWRMSVENALRVTPYKEEPDELKTMPATPEHVIR